MVTMVVTHLLLLLNHLMLGVSSKVGTPHPNSIDGLVEYDVTLMDPYEINNEVADSDSCSHGCTKCSSVNGCLSCRSPFFLTLRREGVRQIAYCDRTCPPGFYKTRHNKKRFCSRCTVLSCSACTATHRCLSCIHGFTLQGKVCVSTKDDDNRDISSNSVVTDDILEKQKIPLISNSPISIAIRGIRKYDGFRGLKPRQRRKLKRRRGRRKKRKHRRRNHRQILSNFTSNISRQLETEDENLTNKLVLIVKRRRHSESLKGKQDRRRRRKSRRRRRRKYSQRSKVNEHSSSKGRMKVSNDKFQLPKALVEFSRELFLEHGRSLPPEVLLARLSRATRKQGPYKSLRPEMNREHSRKINNRLRRMRKTLGVKQRKSNALRRNRIK